RAGSREGTRRGATPERPPMESSPSCAGRPPPGSERTLTNNRCGGASPPSAVARSRRVRTSDPVEHRVSVGSQPYESRVPAGETTGGRRATHQDKRGVSDRWGTGLLTGKPSQVEPLVSRPEGVERVL